MNGRTTAIALAIVAILTTTLVAAGGSFAGGAGAPPSPHAQADAAAVSYAKARKILLNKVIKPSKLAADDHLIAFRLKRMLRAGDKVTVFRKHGGSFTARGPTWFFWIDDDPKAQFEHSTRYVFINARTGRVKVLNRKWWPLVNGKARWYAAANYWKASNWAFSTLPVPSTVSASGTSAETAAASRRSTPRARLAASTAECAVIIDGSGDAKAGFPEDVRAMNEVIGTTFGYTTKLLTPPNNNKADFEKAVGELVADGCKDMMLFIASHGSKASVNMGTGSYTAADLKALIDKYPTMEFKVVVQSCKSGSWVAPLGTTPKITITSTDSDKPSFSADPDTANDPNPDDKGSEFTSGLVEDLKLILTTPALQQRLQNCIAGGKPVLVCKLEIAFESALAKDEDAKAGKAAPQKSP